MSSWAKSILVTAMALWTVMTLGAGWYALRGSNNSPAEAAPVAVLDVATADGERVLQDLDAPAAAELRETLPNHIEATPTRALGAPQAVPRLAGEGGVDRRARAADIDRSVIKPVPQRSAKGVVVLDPGHGRGDPGATHYLPDGSGRWDITEADSNLRNAELIRENLQALGYEVYLTREGDGHGPGAPLPLQFIASDLYARVALARAVEADVYLAIHGNGASVKSISGPETWYCGKHEEGAANEDLARRVQQAMMDSLHEYGYAPPDRGIKEDAQSHHSGDFCQFVVTRETAVPAALLEFLFLSNEDDARVLVDDRSHVLLAHYVAEAIDAFMRDRTQNLEPGT